MKKWQGEGSSKKIKLGVARDQNVDRKKSVTIDVCPETNLINFLNKFVFNIEKNNGTVYLSFSI